MQSEDKKQDQFDLPKYEYLNALNRTQSDLLPV